MKIENAQRGMSLVRQRVDLLRYLDSLEQMTRDERIQMSISMGPRSGINSSQGFVGLQGRHWDLIAGQLKACLTFDLASVEKQLSALGVDLGS